MITRSWPAFIVLVATPHITVAESGYTVHAQKAPPPVELAEAIRDLLSDEAVRIDDGQQPLCTFWFRKELPGKANAEQIKNGLTYREIPITTMVGAIHLPKKWMDFRKQEIPVGVYTLRLAIQPASDDHFETAPHKEFCLLSSSAKDTSPAALEMKPLIEMSAASHGGTHPAVLLLFPNFKPTDEPAIAGKADGIFVLNVKRPVLAAGQKTTLGLSLTFAGHRAE